MLLVAEGRRLGWSRTAVATLVVLSVAVAFTFPLSLALRERRLARCGGG